MMGLADSIANICQNMTYEEVIRYILVKLGPGHRDLFTIITFLSNQHELKLSEFYSYPIAHEAQSKAITGSTDFVSSVNSVTKQEPTNSCKTHNNEGYSRKSNNYTSDNQRNNYHGGNRDLGPGRGRYNGGPRYQVCGIPGHTTLTCRNRFNHSY